MKNKQPNYYNIINIIWSFLLVIAIAFTLTTGKDELNHLYDLQLEASNKTLQAFNLIKERKEELSIDNIIEFPEEDLYHSGLLGPKRSKIRTTEGEPQAKRTSTNPNFAAVYIEMFKEAGLKNGDEIAICTSSSFPALNIAAIIASDVYGLKYITMNSIGASSFGATDPSFTFFDMYEYLYEKHIFKNQLDYISFGGDKDTGYEFNEEIYQEIKSRIDKSNVNFIDEEDFEKNIKLRLKLIYDKCPNVKLFLNVGGSLVAMGNGYTKAVSYRGLVKPPSYLKVSFSNTKEDKKGLLELFLERGIPIIQMLNITKLSYEYGLPIDPIGIPSVGNGDVYYETKYNDLIDGNYSETRCGQPRLQG